MASAPAKTTEMVDLGPMEPMHMATATATRNPDLPQQAPVAALSADERIDAAIAQNKAWLLTCTVGTIVNFTLYGIVMEYATTDGRKLHELSLIFVTGLFYSFVAYVGCAISGEKVSSEIKRYHMGVIALFSMGSTFTSVRSLRYVIYPVQVLAKSCKPVPVMVMGKLLYNKRYSARRYAIIFTMVLGVALFVIGGKSTEGSQQSGLAQLFGLSLLVLSLCFDGGTGAYEEALMGDAHIGPFNLMLNIQVGKTLLAALLLIVGGEINAFLRLANEQAFSLLMLGATGACGQVFIFLTIAKFGALTCSVIGLARKIITLLLSLLIYQHPVSLQQSMALCLAIGAMVLNFMDKRTKKKARPTVGEERHRDRKDAPAEEVAGLTSPSEDLLGIEEGGESKQQAVV